MRQPEDLIVCEREPLSLSKDLKELFGFYMQAVDGIKQTLPSERNTPDVFLKVVKRSVAHSQESMSMETQSPLALRSTLSNTSDIVGSLQQTFDQTLSKRGMLQAFDLKVEEFCQTKVCLASELNVSSLWGELIFEIRKNPILVCRVIEESCYPRIT